MRDSIDHIFEVSDGHLLQIIFIAVTFEFLPKWVDFATSQEGSHDEFGGGETADLLHVMIGCQLLGYVLVCGEKSQEPFFEYTFDLVDMLLHFGLQLRVKAIGWLEMFNFDRRVATSVVVLGTLLLGAGFVFAQHLYLFEVVGSHLTTLLL